MRIPYWLISTVHTGGGSDVFTERRDSATYKKYTTALFTFWLEAKLKYSKMDVVA